MIIFGLQLIKITKGSLKMKKNHFYKIVLSLVGIVVSLNAFSQFYQTGVDPFKIQWRQIETNNIHLVYDSVFENEAQRLAAILDYGSTLTGNTLHQKPKKISVIVRNYNAYSNGEVVWAPKRMEIYPVSPQDIYAQDWFEQLAVHENRHVAQMNRLNVGLTSVGNIFFGQAATGASTLFLHQWFVEGDAVTTETALQKQAAGANHLLKWKYAPICWKNNFLWNLKKPSWAHLKIMCRTIIS